MNEQSEYMDNDSTEFEFERGFVYFPEWWFREIPKIRLTSKEFQVLGTIIIYTWGSYPYRTEAVIPLDSFANELSIKHKSSVSRAIRGLLNKNIITKQGESRHPIYSVQTDYEKWVRKPRQKKFSVGKYVSQVLKEAGNE